MWLHQPVQLIIVAGLQGFKAPLARSARPCTSQLLQQKHGYAATLHTTGSDSSSIGSGGRVVIGKGTGNSSLPSTEAAQAEAGEAARASPAAGSPGANEQLQKVPAASRETLSGEILQGRQQAEDQGAG